MLGSVPKSATKLFAVALLLLAEAHAQSMLPTVLVSFSPLTFGVMTNVFPNTSLGNPILL